MNLLLLAEAVCKQLQLGRWPFYSGFLVVDRTILSGFVLMVALMAVALGQSFVASPQRSRPATPPGPLLSAAYGQQWR